MRMRKKGGQDKANANKHTPHGNKPKGLMAQEPLIFYKIM